MPGGDGTGPRGQGPRTGGGFGLCPPGSGFRRGQGRGRGMGRCRRGEHGYAGQQVFSQDTGVQEERETDSLQEQLSLMKNELESLRDSIEQLKSGAQ
ncbi:MAG: DUF5320 domain-containing protein [Vulcanimicrobiota bacterium]